LVNSLNNDLPEPIISCPDEVCGRKFKNAEERDNHVKRRHPEIK